MKTEQLRIIIIEQYLKIWVSGEWIWNDDGTIDVIGNLAIHYLKNMRKLPVEFNIVTGYFSCSMTSLISLEGVPKQVGSWCRWQSNAKKCTEKEIRSNIKVSGRVVI